MVNAFLLIPGAPLFGALLMLFLGRRLPKSAVSFICVGSVLVSFAVSVTALASMPPQDILLGSWLPSIGAEWGFHWDALAGVMALVVTGIGSLIHIYSVGYMKDEGGYYRFFGYLNFFIFAMLLLVLANNYVLLFAGWEGVGLASYLLIGFWFRTWNAAGALPRPVRESTMEPTAAARSAGIGSWSSPFKRSPAMAVIVSGLMSAGLQWPRQAGSGRSFRRSSG